VEFVLGPYSTGKELNETSAVDFARMIERDTGFYCRQGYGALLAKLAEGLPVQLNAPVHAIDTGNRQNRVEVKSARGTIVARFGIVTVSTEVLNAGKIKFESERPVRHLEAASRLKLGSYDRIALELPGNPLGLQRDDLMLEKSEGIRTAALLANVGGSSLVTLDVAGKFGRELSAQGEKAMTDFAIDWLTGLFGADIRKAVKRSAATQWNADPWTLGAISSASPGAQAARRAYAEPMRDRLFFAGEAAHETLWGTVNGAWESGERAAEGVLRRLGVLRDPVEPRPQQRPSRSRS
jgi:monoamine oxidase